MCWYSRVNVVLFSYATGPGDLFAVEKSDNLVRKNKGGKREPVSFLNRCGNKFPLAVLGRFDLLPPAIPDNINYGCRTHSMHREEIFSSCGQLWLLPYQRVLIHCQVTVCRHTVVLLAQNDSCKNVCAIAF